MPLPSCCCLLGWVRVCFFVVFALSWPGVVSPLCFVPRCVACCPSSVVVVCACWSPHYSCVLPLAAMSAFSSAPLTLVADADPSHIALEALPQLDGTGNEPLVPHVNLLAPQGPLMEPLVGSHSLAPLVQEGDNLPCSMVVQHHFSSGIEEASVGASFTEQLASAASVADDVFVYLSIFVPSSGFYCRIDAGGAQWQERSGCGVCTPGCGAHGCCKRAFAFLSSSWEYCT